MKVSSVLSILGLALAAGPQAGDAADAQAWILAEGAREANWKKAAKRCERSTALGRSDWRLPTERELFDLSRQAANGDENARGAIRSLNGAAAWSRDVSSSDLAWAASFDHGYLFRLHVTNRRGLDALCVSAPVTGDSTDLEEGPWLRPLAGETESPLTWGCDGELVNPVLQTGTLAPFRQALPPGRLAEVVSVDFVIDEEGRALFAGPTPEAPSRYGSLAVETLMTFRFVPATCDGVEIPAFHRLDFGDPPPE